MSVYKFIRATTTPVPVIVSVPHCGTEFPEDLKDQYKKELIHSPDDTDWFVDKLYDFAPAMGIHMITARYSRWVIDLNRHPESKALYSDGRIITGLCPTTTFLGDPLYQDERNEVSPEDLKRRLDQYFWPYHKKIQELITDHKARFGKVLLWDCHSIRLMVPTIRKEKFPDLILGDADGTAASPGLIEEALTNLESFAYSVSHNDPFKGGYITRHFGRPGENQHALQLEMPKVNYMDDAELAYDPTRAAKMREVLRKTLAGLIDRLA
jgi:N-formylglutamate deformylase